MMIDRDEFLKSYNIEQEDFEAADMPWEELAAIYEDYQAMEGKLRNIGKDFVYDICMISSGQESIPTATEQRTRGIFWKKSSGRGWSILNGLRISTGPITINM